MLKEMRQRYSRRLHKLPYQRAPKPPKEMVHALAAVDPSDDAVKAAELFIERQIL